MSYNPKQLFKSVFETLDSVKRGTYRTLVLRTLLLRILALIVQGAVQRAQARAVPSPLAQLVTDIRQHPEKRLTVEDMARTLGYSSTAHFSSQFQLFCGMSPRAYSKSAKSRQFPPPKRLSS